MEPPAPYPPVPPPPPPPPRASNGPATAALVLGLMTLVTCGATAIPALVCGHLGTARAARSGVGRSSALTGIVFGWVCSVLWLMLWVWFILLDGATSLASIVNNGFTLLHR